MHEGVPEELNKDAMKLVISRLERGRRGQAEEEAITYEILKWGVRLLTEQPQSQIIRDLLKHPSPRVREMAERYWKKMGNEVRKSGEMEDREGRPSPEGGYSVLATGTDHNRDAASRSGRATTGVGFLWKWGVVLGVMIIGGLSVLWSRRSSQKRR